MKQESKGIMIGAALGVIAGAVAGILLAPKSGKETREDIKNYFNEIKDKIVAELQELGELSKEKYELAVNKIVAGYETEKKLSSRDAKEIKETLINNYKEVEDAVKKAGK